MVTTFFVFFVFVQYAVYSDYYSLDGSNNNKKHPEWGTPGNTFRRLPTEHTKLTYTDGFHEINSALPNPRIISNAIGQMPKAQSKHDKYAPLSGISWIVSKTLAQDLCGTKTELTPETYYPIIVPPCDWYWDIHCTNKTVMSFWRNPYKNTTNNMDNITYPTAINGATAFVDLNYIYGQSIEDQNGIRLFHDGLIETSKYKFESADDLVDAQLDATGYVTNIHNHSIKRFYENNNNDRSLGGVHSGISGYTLKECPFASGEATGKPLLTHIWKLNHNRIARELAEETGSTDDEYLFREARALQIATAQHIIYTEYVPLFLSYPITNDLQYNSSVDPAVSTWFCGLAHRYAHPATPNRLPFGGYHNDKSQAMYGEYINEIISSVTIGEGTTYPCMGIDSIKNNNQSGNVYVESMLGGLMLEPENLITPRHNEYLRSFLQFIWHYRADPSLKEGQRDADGLQDTFATDILRTRDWGMPSYNDARELFNLPRVSKWEELTDDEWYLEILPTLYEDIDDLDAYVGALLEKVEADYEHYREGSGHIGPLFAAMLRDQYYRSAAGDRLFYLYNETLRTYAEGLTLSKIIQLNTNLKNLSKDIFTADSKNVHSAPKSETQSMTLLHNAVYFEWDFDEEDITFTFRLNCDTKCDIGWIAIGFGEGEMMKGKDIIKMNFDGDDINIIDSYCPHDRWLPVADIDESQDVTYIDGSNADGVISVTFKRPLNKYDVDDFFNYDYPIFPYDGEQCCIIVAYNVGSMDGKHAADHRTPVIINWNTGSYESGESITTERVRLTHGLSMIFLFGVMYPISAFIAHYFKHFPWTRAYHKQSGKVGLATAFTSAFFAISSVTKQIATTHGILGLICLCLLCTTAMMGFATNMWLDSYKRSWIYNKIKWIHVFCAVSILFLSPVTLWFGWEHLGILSNQYVDADFGFFLFYGFVVLLIIIGESYTRWWSHYTLKVALEENFNKHNYHIFSWSEIGEKVSSGAAWIIIDGLIYDVTVWQYSHPGGRCILLHHFGTDCTPLFYGKRDVGEAHGNIKHSHSDAAKQQLLNMIVGEVSCDMNANRSIAHRRSSKKDPSKLFAAAVTPTATHSILNTFKNPRKLTVTTLIGKTLLTNKTGYRKILLLEFLYDVREHGIDFDGDYVLLHEVDKCTISRAYAPIHPKFILCNKSKFYDKNVSVQYEQRLFLMVRIYKNGRMSAVLDHLQIGHTMRITGPFRREEMLPKTESNSIDQVKSDEWTKKWLVKLANDPTKDDIDLALEQLQQSVRGINMDEAKYWRRIVLICGGTGIAPMLNMIHHHLNSAQNEDIRCNLIWHNRTVGDMCMEQQLKYYRDCYPQRFWVDLKFDEFDAEVIYDDITDIDNNKERFNWARIHEQDWSILDMIEMVTYFMEKGIPLTVSRGMKRNTLLMTEKYTSIEMEVQRDMDHEGDLNQCLKEVIDEESAVELIEENDVIILCGPRPFTDKIQEAFFEKKPSLFNRIISLD